MSSVVYFTDVKLKSGMAADEHEIIIFFPKQLQLHHFPAQDNLTVNLQHQRVIGIPGVRA